MSYNFEDRITDIRFDDLDLSQPIDKVFVNHYSNLKTSIDSDFLLETGKYKLTIGNPTGNISELEDSFNASSYFINPETGIQEQKTVRVYKWEYDVQNNKLYLYVDYHNFVVTALMVYGIIAIVLVATGAIAANSILEKIEKVTGGIGTEFKTNPAIWAIIAIFLIPVLITGFKTYKKIG